MRAVHAVTAALLLAVLVLLTPAAAAAAPVGPQAPQIEMTKIRLSCTGDTVHTSVTVETNVAVDVTAVLLMRDASGRHTATDRSTVLPVKVGVARYTADVDAGGLPATVHSYRVDLYALGQLRGSGVIQVARCAPPAVVPEVPAAALVPLSLAATSALVLRAHRRRERA